MLKVFRDNLKYLSWVLWLVIAVFVLFMASDFVRGGPGAGAPSDAAATIGGLEVSFEEFERTYRQTEDFYRQTYGEQFNRELAQQLGLPLQVLDGLIADKILLAEADRMGLRVTDEEVARYIKELPIFQLPDGRFVGEESYRQILRSNGLAVDRFEESVRADLLSGKVRSLLAETLFVSDEEVVNSYRERTETANIRYVRLSSDSLRDQVAFEEADLEDHFASNQEGFRIPERRVVDYLLVDPDQLRTEIEIPEEEIRAYYDTNPDEFTQEEQVRARHILLQIGSERTAEAAEQELQRIRRRVESGEDFAALAEEFSDDPGSKNQGGDLGFFGRGQMIPEFEEAAFGAQPGDLVGPIQTNFGYHLVEVLEKRPGGQRSLEETAEEIRNRLLSERSRSRAERQAAALATRLREGKIDSTERLRDVADSAAAVTVHTTPPFGREDNVPGIGRATAFTVSAFELSVGEISAPVPVARGWGILRLVEIQEPRIPELAEVRDEVRDALLDQRQLDLATARLAEARESLEAGRTLEEVAAELELSVQETGEFRRLGPLPGLGTSPEITSAALALDTGGVGGPLVHDRDVVLFEVADRKRYDPKEFEQQRDQARENLRQERLGKMLTSLIAQRRQELGVRYDTQLLRNFELIPEEG